MKLVRIKIDPFDKPLLAYEEYFTTPDKMAHRITSPLFMDENSLAACEAFRFVLAKKKELLQGGSHEKDHLGWCSVESN